MSFSGFALKGKKKTLGAAAAKTSLGGFRVEKEKAPDDKKEVVVGFTTTGDALLKDPSAGSKNGPLVIPCIKENWTEDQKAAQALLEDIRNSSRKEQEDAEESTLVIPIAGAAGEKDPSDKTTKDAPMLTRNRIPGMEKIVGETNKFKHDLSMRPDELDIHSEAFEAVPIEEFGAALLRGMGWNGKDRVKPTGSKVQMRHYRLGLGATPKPTLEPKQKKNFIPKPEPRERSGHHHSNSSSSSRSHKRSRSRSRERPSKRR